MQSQTQLFESIFKRETNNGNNISFLEDIATQYPYFTPAHFFLLQQKGIVDDRQAAKAALLFNNPHWLSYQLNFTKENTIEGPVAGEPIAEPTLMAIADDVEDKAFEEINIEPFVTVADNNTTAERPESIVNIAEEVMGKSESDLSTVVDEMRPAQEPETGATVFSEDENNITNETLEGSKITATVEEITTKKDVAPNEMMLFEPMHMVDYFASQGIKLSEEVQTGDKLGKQLRSFTEWLKTMKKIHTDKLPESSQQTDITVQALAEKSNAEDEVVTESMAEVFAMQGKLSKAKAVYQKLSLLDPSKSAFFAAKIEQLKG